MTTAWLPAGVAACSACASKIGALTLACMCAASSSGEKSAALSYSNSEALLTTQLTAPMASAARATSVRTAALSARSHSSSTARRPSAVMASAVSCASAREWR